VHTCIDDGEFVAARKLWYRIMPFVEIATVGVGGERPDWIAVIKRGLELRGRPVGGVRAPMLPLTDDVDRRLVAAVQAIGLTATPKLAMA
jgi:dihydrodipicolinate synthase/N-acetylneuraminate lyase